MSNASPRSRMGWAARLLIGLLLLLAGAGAAVWALARWDEAARLAGIGPEIQLRGPALPLSPPRRPIAIAALPAAEPRIAALEARLQTIENTTKLAAGSAGRADALLVAFAARRSVDRGVPLGYIETLLTDRFGDQHPRAVATIISLSRQPVRLDQLIAGYEAAEDELLAGDPNESIWSSFQRELGSLISVRHADRPSEQPSERYARAHARLAAGQVDGALAETMRLPGATRTKEWIDQARRYIAVHRALDEIESAALLAGSR